MANTIDPERLLRIAERLDDLSYSLNTCLLNGVIKELREIADTHVVDNLRSTQNRRKRKHDTKQRKS